MKIVQSFWSKPYMSTKSSLPGSELSGGWPHRSLNYCSWALSCLQLRKFYNSVELITDSLGKEILVNQLQLPYTRVSTAMDDLAGYDAQLFGIGKLYAYQVQDEPFLHVDGDIFIMDAFDKDISSAALIAQNTDKNYPGYFGKCQPIWDLFTYIPAYFEDVYKHQRCHCANLGIMGGNDMPFIRRFVAEAFNFYEKNIAAVITSLKEIDHILINIILEQTLFYSYARHYQAGITYLFPEVTNHPDGVGLFHAAKHNKHYVHCYGFYKSLRASYAAVEYKLRTEYAPYYQRISDLVAATEI